MQPVLHNRYFSVEGVRCARCIHAIESALQSEASVADVRLNMSTNRLSISWEGEEGLWRDFMQKVRSLGYGIKPYEAPKIEPSQDRQLLRCMALAGFSMGNIMLLSVALWSSEASLMGMATRDLLHWISALIALPTIAYAGRPFFSSAISVLRNGHTNMDVPISLALILACSMSVHETIHSGEHAYFDSAVMLLFFLLIGRWLDARARGKARKNAQDLLAMMQGYATVIKDNKLHDVPITALQEGMKVHISAGEKVPTDCEILEGTSDVDTSLVTGETLPKLAVTGDVIYGGTVNLSSALTCRVLKASEDSLLADIIRLMEQAEQGRARYVRLADKAAKLYTPIVHTLAICAFLGWYFVGGIVWQDALLIAITTLIITCPCALGLAVPVVQVLASSWLMKRGVLLKSGDALERLSEIDAITMDKTGTLTLGKPTLLEVPEEPILQISASLAAHSKHPYSRAIVQAYDGEILIVTDVEETPGIGMKCHYKGMEYRLGKDKHKANTVLEQDGIIQYVFSFQDTPRVDAAETIQALPYDVHLLSGDNMNAVNCTAKQLGITAYDANMLPADKVAYIASLQQKKHKVLMVGDGLNDAPSLAQANVSMSPATGMDITQNTADIIFQGEKLAPVMQTWRMAQLSTSLVKQNFMLAIVYNVIAIPIALAGLVTPMVAAIAMSLSSLVVIANSFRINRLKEQ